MNMMKGHDYEELASARYVTAGSLKYDYAVEKGPHLAPAAPLPGHMATSNASVSTLAGSEMSRQTHRRRENPLFDDFDEREQLVKENTKYSGNSRCCHIVVTAVCFLCIALSVVMAMLLTGMITPIKHRQEMSEMPETAALRSSHNSTKDELQKAVKRIAELEAKHEKLLYEFQAMKVDFTMKLLILEQNISSQSQKIIRQESALTQEGASLLSHITAVNSSLYQQIQSVSKMEGPRGPMGYNGSQGAPGPGDLSKCIYKKVTAGGRAATIFGTWVPTAQQLQVSDVSEWVLLGVECSGEGVSEHKLAERTQDGVQQYRCECTSTSSTGTTYCNISMWACPVTS